jgi:hypothetical protein
MIRTHSLMRGAAKSALLFEGADVHSSTIRGVRIRVPLIGGLILCGIRVRALELGLVLF